MKYLLVVFLWHLFLKCYEGSWVALVFCVTEASNSPRPATQWTDNLPRDATMIYFLYSVMLKFGTKHFGFIISFTARWIGKKKREKLESRQEACPGPSSSLELTSAIAVLVAAKMLQSNVIVSSQGASFLLSQRQFYIFFYLPLSKIFLNFTDNFWKIG